MPAALDKQVQMHMPCHEWDARRVGLPSPEIFLGTEVHERQDEASNPMLVLVADYPELTEDHILPCLAYAADRERRLVTAAKRSCCSTRISDEEPPRRIISARPQNLTSPQPVVQRCGLTRCAKPPFADATSVYSISSSVSAIRLAGISSPRDLAAFILMTNSYLIGCRTGRSAGLAPLRIFPT